MREGDHVPTLNASINSTPSAAGSRFMACRPSGHGPPALLRKFMQPPEHPMPEARRARLGCVETAGVSHLELAIRLSAHHLAVKDALKAPEQSTPRRLGLQWKIFTTV